MSTPPPQQPRRSAGDGKKLTPPQSSIITRNGARKAKIQTRAMCSGAKPSALILAAKKKGLQKKKQSVDTVLKDYYQIAMDSQHKIKGATGFVTEPRMAEHKCLWDQNYPECPERLTSVIDRCNELGLLDQCKQFQPRAATKEELVTLHSASVYEMLETTHQNNNVEYLEELSSKFDAVYIHPSTHELALIAAGSTIDLVDQVISCEVQNGAAFVRPPGHHAMRSEPCGYCFYNNVALAAKHAIDKRGLNRILIVDWDVHHGQATQQMFYDDPRVVYFSIHRYEHGSFWPSLRHSNFNYVGCGKGTGYNFNVPLNRTGMTDADYLAIWHQLLLPMAFEYQPELIIVSAGYDAAYGCPEGEMLVTPACYGHLTHLLMSVCSSVCVVLEGGYCIQSLSEAAAITLRTLLGYRPPVLEKLSEPCDEIRDTILNCIYAHKPYWSCYNYQETYSLDTTIPNVCDKTKQKHTVTIKWEGDETRPDKFKTRDCYPLQDDDTKRQISERLNNLRITTDLSTPQYDVGYIYDEAMLKHKNICEPGHVECPERILRIHERHRDFGLLERVHHLTPRRATDDEILTVHTQTHLNRLKMLSSTKLRDLNSKKEEFDSVYFHPDSLESAATALGCTLQAVESVLSGRCRAAVCAVRPPGHHAELGAPAGFCLLNNVAAAASLAARAARAARAHVRQRRVLLLDWDVHHGNATQNHTIRTDHILYISIHRYDDGAFFPHSKKANYDVVGEGPGEGYNVNIPWNKRGMGDVEYLAAFTQIILPIAYEYNPDLVLISAGFDACVGDPLGGCKVSPECFGRMTQLIQSVSAGKVILVLEGGYNVTSISYAMSMCTKALLGDPIPHQYDPKQTPHWSAVETINNVIKTHKKYWKSLKFQAALPIENVLEEPAPSRGLVITDDQNISARLSEISLCSSLNDSLKSISSVGSKNSSSLEISLERHMANLTIDKAPCADGIHCGTDDEDNSKKEPEQGGSSSITKKDSAVCSTGQQQNVEAGSSKKEAEKPTLVDYLAANMQAISDGEMFAVIPLTYCPHLESLQVIPKEIKFEQGIKCINCDHTVENWVCLHCYTTACGRSINGHMQAHYHATHHPLVLSLSDLSVWCNSCDAYIDNPLLYDAKNNAHRCKFNEDMPWCYPERTIDMQ